MNKMRKRRFLFGLLCIFILIGLTACGKDGVKVKSANALARKLASDSTAKINVPEDLVLEEPIVITGEKEIVGEGKITAVLEDGEELYMFTVAEGGKLTIGGSVKIDAAGLMGAVHVQDGGSAIVKGKAVVKNASEAAANALVEGSLEVKGGNLKGAKGHNVINKNTTTISGGKVTGSGDKYAGIYNEGTLTQSGGKVSAAYNNISNIKGSTFTFEGGSNEDSTRDGVFVAEGATLKATNKDATIVNAGARGILLQGQADIKVITVKECGDSLVKVAKTGVLNLGNGILQGGNYHGVENAGTMNMLGGNIQMNANCGIVNTGTLKVTSGNIAENANKGILNKHEGKADVTSAMVTFTSNKTAIANEDKAVFEFAKAKLLMSTQTNIYCYDGTINIHDASLNASTSNNVRIVDGVINMINVEVKGNSQKSGTSHHGIYMEGGVINAENVTVSMTTGNGIRNKGGVFKGKNIIMHDINRVAISQGKHDYLDVEGLTEIEGLEIQSTNYANIWNEGGGTIKITNGKLAVAASNSVRSNDGRTELTNVTIPGHKEGSKDNIHGIYLEGGEIIAKNVTIQDVAGNALRNKNGKFVGTNIKMTNIKGQTAISNLPLDDENKDGIINIDGLTIKDSASKNITLDSGVTTIKNATLGKTGGNNIKMQNNAATLKLYNVKIEGQIEDATANTHGIMVEGGNVYGDNIQIVDTNACGIRCKMGVVNLKNVTMTNLGQAGISNSKMTKDGELQGVGDVTIDGLTLTKAGTNNVVLDAGKVTIKNGLLGKVETNNHNTKVSGTGVLTMKNVKVEGTSNNSKYGVIAEGGEAILENVEIYDLAKSGIHANRETSKVTGKNVSISNGVYAITGSNGSITVDGLTTSNISANNVLADNLLKVTLKNSTLGETPGHNVKVTGDAIVSLNKTEILGVTDGSKHGVMAEGGDVNLKDVTISNVKNTAVRINKATSKVTGENVTITNSGNGVTGTNGKVVIDGLKTTGITGNNVVSDGSANFTIKNGDLCQVSGDAHNVKVAGSADIKITDTVVRGTTSNSKYGIIAEGGDAVLKNVEIYDVAKSAIHANRETSKVTGENITIANGVSGITGSAGTIELKKLKTSGLSENNITISGTCVVTVTKSTGGYGLGVTNGHSVKVVDDAIVNLDTVEIEGVTATDRHGVMAEGGDVVLNNVLIHDVANSAIRINKPTSEVTGTKVVIKDSNNAVSGSDGKVVIDGLTTSGISNNNVLVSGSSDEAGCVVTITNGNLGWTSGHNVKAEAYGKVILEDTEINGVVSSDKYGVMAEGGYAKLDNVAIKAVTAAAIRSNRDTSVVEGNDVTITKSGVGVSVSAGNVTIDKLTSSATTSNVTVSGGETVITNSTLKKTGDSNAVVSGGVLKLDEVDINGTSANYGILVSAGKLEVKPNVTVKNTAAEGVYNQGGTIEGDKLTIQDTGATALRNTNGGKTTLTNLTVSGTKSAYNIWNEGENSSVSVDGGELGKSASNNVVAAGGTVTLKNIDVNGTGGSSSNNIHGVLASGGDVVLENVGITGAATGAIRVNNANSKVEGTDVTFGAGYIGISASAGETIINGLTTSGLTQNNILASDSAKVTINAYANGDKSELGATKNSHNVKATPDALVTLNDVKVLGSTSSNAVMAEGGDFVLNNVDIEGAAKGTGIRINNTASLVTGTNVTINGCNYGISYRGNIDITGLTCNATTVNVEVAGGTFNIKDATFGKTAESNILVTGGTATLEKATINGSSEKYGIEVSGGTLNLKDEVTVKDTKLEGIYNHGGTINGAEAKKVTIQDTGSTAIWNTSGSSTTLKDVTISNVIAGHSIKNENANSTVVINGGEFGKTKSNNVYAANGTITLNDVVINGTTNGSTHGIIAAGGDVVLDTVTIKEANTSTIRINNANSEVTGKNVTLQSSVNGIHMSPNGKVTIDGLTTSGMSGNNIRVGWDSKSTEPDESGEITINAYEDGKKSVLGETDGHNVVAYVGVVNLNNVQVNGTSATGDKNGNSALFAHGGDLNLVNVDITGANGGTGIRINRATSLVTGSDVTINECNYGISYNGNIDITRLTCNATTTNVESAGGTFKITDGTFGKTAGSNILVTGGTATLEKATINGSSEKYGIEVSGGTLNLKDEVTVKDTKLEGIYNHGGTINGAEAKKVTIQDTGSTAIWNISGSSTTLKNVAISGVKGGHSIKNENADSTVTIDGGELGQSPSNNVVVSNGTVTLKNVDINGTGGKASDNIHGVLASGGDVVLEKVTIEGSATGAIRVNNANSKVEGTDVTFGAGYIGISASNGETIINGLTTSGLTQNNILASESAKVTINAYASGDKSALGVTKNSHNVKATPDALVTLNGVKVLGSTSSNAVMAEGGDFALNNVDIEGAAKGSGIRINNLASLVTGTTVTINGCNYGISYKGNIDITGLTCNATTTNVEITEGTYKINNGTFGKTSGSNILVTGGTATLENATIQGGPTGIMASGGEIVVNGMTTSGITGNNILADKSGNVTVNAYADGTKSVLGIAGGHNVKTLADGLITLNDAIVQGTTSTKHYAVMAEGGDFVLNSVDITGVPNGAGIRANKATSAVTGTDISISNVKEGISNTSATFDLENLTIGSITGSYEFYNAGTLKLAGEIDANIYNDIKTTVEAKKALTGDIQVDWKDGVEPEVAIQFASKADADASKPYIKLGAIQAAKNELLYVNDTAVLTAPILVPSTAAATLQDAVNAIAATGKPGAVRVAENLTIDATVTIPAGSDVTIINTNGAKTITRAATLTDKHMIEVASGATLTIASTGDNTTPALYIDGGSKSEPQVITKGYTSLLHSSGTLNVEMGVEVTNAKGSTTYGRGYGILTDKGTTTFKGKITSMEGQAGDRGVATVVSGGATFVFENAIIENNKSNGISAVYIEGGSKVTARNTIFKNNSTDKSGGAISFSKDNTVNKLTVENCHFEGNSTKENGGAIFYESKNGKNVSITGTTFTGNSAANGGAIYNTGTISITNSTFTSNTATNRGAVIYNTNHVTLTGSDKDAAIIQSNTATGWGGAIYTEGSGKLTISGYEFTGNKGQYGGAICAFSETEISESSFEKNGSDAEGGAIYTQAKLTLTNCTFDGNNAKTNGGALCLAKSGVTYTLNGTSDKAVFKNNASGSNVGGAIYLANGTLEGNGYTFTENTNSPEDIYVKKGKGTNKLEGQFTETVK